MYAGTVTNIVTAVHILYINSCPCSMDSIEDKRFKAQEKKSSNTKNGDLSEARSIYRCELVHKVLKLLQQFSPCVNSTHQSEHCSHGYIFFKNFTYIF
jgi:GTP cyclohydrolase FolE2